MNNFTKLITNIKNNNHASINYDASIETLATARSTAYIPISFLGNYRGYINENYYCTTDSRNRKFQTQKNPSIIPVTSNPEYPPWGFTWHVISIIAENKSHAHHNTYLHTVNAVA